MDKNYIKERLQEKNRRIRLPKAIEFKLDGGELRLTVSGKGVVANMQDNGSAFEGWAICIKSRMKEVEKVVVGWEQPDYSRDLKEKNRQQKHYNRFRLRAAFFEENYSWVSIAEKNKKEVEDVKNILVLQNWLERIRKEVTNKVLSIKRISEFLNFPILAQPTLKKI